MAELRRTLAGTADGSTRGDLDRELEKFDLATALPDEFRGNLPAIEDLEAELRALPESEGEQE